MMLRSVLTALLAPAIVSAAPAAQPVQCEPAPPVLQTPGMAANSTYVSDSEPPQRFAHVPAAELRVRFGQGSIDAICGVPPCGKVFLGCQQGAVIVLPDPFRMSDAEFSRIVRHELGHRNGWPATHGA
jgi:hypothetical protein